MHIKKKLLISGASGSIGKRIKVLLENESIEVYSLSLRNSKTIKKDIASIGEIDFFLHLASQNSKMRHSSYSNDEIHILNQAKKVCSDLNIKNFIFTSTSLVYGKEYSQKEAYTEGKESSPSNMYAKAKLLCEEELKNWCINNDINLWILRLAPFIDIKSNSKIAKLIRLTNILNFFISYRDLLLNKRSFIDCDHLLKVIDKIIKSEKISSEKSFQKIYNVANPEVLSTLELIKKYRNNENKLKLIYLPSFLISFLFRVPAIGKIFKNLSENHFISTKAIYKDLQF